jgi:hypothetical protein
VTWENDLGPASYLLNAPPAGLDTPETAHDGKQLVLVIHGATTPWRGGPADDITWSRALSLAIRKRPATSFFTTA